MIFIHIQKIEILTGVDSLHQDKISKNKLKMLMLNIMPKVKSLLDRQSTDKQLMKI